MAYQILPRNQPCKPRLPKTISAPTKNPFAIPERVLSVSRKPKTSGVESGRVKRNIPTPTSVSGLFHQTCRRSPRRDSVEKASLTCCGSTFVVRSWWARRSEMRFRFVSNSPTSSFKRFCVGLDHFGVWRGMTPYFIESCSRSSLPFLRLPLLRHWKCPQTQRDVSASPLPLLPRR